IALIECRTNPVQVKLWRANVNALLVDKPNSSAHALRYHLYVHDSPSRVTLSRTNRKVPVAEFTPHAHHFDLFGFVCFNQKFVSHEVHPYTWVWRVFLAALLLRTGG